MVAVVNPTYFSVLTGTIEAANTAGAATFAAAIAFGAADDNDDVPVSGTSGTSATGTQ
jgi:hypothetical protein